MQLIAATAIHETKQDNNMTCKHDGSLTCTKRNLTMTLNESNNGGNLSACTDGGGGGGGSSTYTPVIMLAFLVEFQESASQPSNQS